MARFSGRMFSIIEERRLYAIVAENVAELLNIDEARTLAMIAQHLDEFPVDRVALQLQRLLRTTTGCRRSPPHPAARSPRHTRCAQVTACRPFVAAGTSSACSRT
jgi:hypothetical protein